MVEQIVVTVFEGSLDLLQVLNRQGHDLALLLALGGEVTLQTVLVLAPLLGVELLVLHKVADDVQHAEMAADVELNVHLVVVLGQDITSLTTNKEVNARDFIVIHEDVLVRTLYHGFEPWADPCNEDHRAVF